MPVFVKTASTDSYVNTDHVDRYQIVSPEEDNWVINGYLANPTSISGGNYTGVFTLAEGFTTEADALSVLEKFLSQTAAVIDAQAITP